MKNWEKILVIFLVRFITVMLFYVFLINLYINKVGVIERDTFAISNAFILIITFVAVLFSVSYLDEDE